MRRQLARINWIKLQWLKIRIRMINKCLNLNEFGWYIPGLAVINAHVGHTRYYFSNISWNWLCYQRAFSAIYQNYFWKLSLFAGTILLQIWLYTHMPSLVWIVKKTKWNITHCSECCVGSLLQYIWMHPLLL